MPHQCCSLVHFSNLPQLHANNAAFYPLFFHLPSFPPHFVVFLNVTSTTHLIAITILHAIALLFLRKYQVSIPQTAG